MRTKQIFVYGLLAVMFAFIATACEQPNDPKPTTITYTVTQSGGTDGSVDSTGIVFTFSKSVDSLNLTAADITIGGTASKGANAALTGTGTTRTLPITVNSAGLATVVIVKDGIETASKDVTVYKAGQTASTDITYTLAQTGGTDGTATSTGIVFTFSKSVDSLNLTAADITVGGTASKGSAALTGSGTTRTLPITVNAAGLATVQINKSGIEAGQKTVSVHKAGEATPEYWSITWHLNGGTESAGAYPTQIVKGSVLAKPSPDPTRAGNTFEGWYTNSGLTTAYNFSSPVTANLNLYAKWETAAADITYTLAQIGGENGVTDSTGIVFTFSASIDSLGLTAADITVGGAAAKNAATEFMTLGADWVLWQITVNNTGPATVSISKTGIEAGQKTVPVYKAGDYVPEYWTITWNLDGGEKGAGAYPAQIEKGTVLAQPSPDPTRSGNTFEGWYSDSGLTQTYIFTSPVTADLNLYAKWEAVNWSITWNLDGGTAGGAYPTQILKYAVLAQPSPDPAKDGYIFGGWYTDSGLTTAYNFSAAVYENLSLYAKWIDITTPTPGLAYELIDGNTAYSVSKGTVTSGAVVIPATHEGLPVTQIADNAFAYCYITRIYIGENVTTIGDSAFDGCTNLTNIIIDTDKVTNTQTANWVTRFPATGLSITFKKDIGNYACYFSPANATKLTSVTIAEGVTTIGQYAFNGCTGLTGTLTIPASVTTIGDSVFRDCSGLTGTLTIPANVTTIGANTFYGCTGLTSVTIGAGVTSIGERAFSSCTGLTGTLTIPAGVTSIGQYAFQNCSGLTGVTIPAGVTTIGNYAFDGCSGLTSVTFAGTIASDSFGSTSPFPGDLRDKYFADPGGGAGTYTRTGTGTAADPYVWTKS